MSRGLLHRAALLALLAAGSASGVAGADTPGASSPSASAPVVPDLTVRGTVGAVDLRRGAFVLRVNAHTRTVFVTPDTDVSGLGRAAGGGVPVRPGERVTVGGPMQPDGTVLACLLSLSPNAQYRTPPGYANRILIGSVSSPRSKLFGGDIKIRSADGADIKLSIPRGIPVRRAGRQISIYDLGRQDVIRVIGTMGADGLQAARIDVLAPAPSVPPAPPSPSKAGL